MSNSYNQPTSRASATASGSFSFSSFSSSSSSTSGGHTTSHRYAGQMRADPSGATVRTASQHNNQPPSFSERKWDFDGRRVESGHADRDADNRRRIEDVTDDYDRAAREREYEERMEDEYAKREGGA